MDLSFFATQIAQPDTNFLTKADENDNKNKTVQNKFAFLETILGNISPDGGLKTDSKNIEESIPQDGVITEKADLALLQLALLGQDVDQTLDEKLAGLKIENLLKTEGNRVEQLTKLINHLTSGLPQEFSEESSIEDLVARLNKRLEKLSASLSAFRNNNFSEEDTPFKLLIATGLNPAQFTKITSRIEEVEAKLGRELTVEDLIVGVGNIIPVPGDNEHEFSTTDALGLLLKNKEEDGLPLGDKDILDNSAMPFANPEIGNEKPKTAGELKHYDMQTLLNLMSANKLAPAAANSTAPTASAAGQESIEATVNDTTILPEDGITPLPETLSNAEFKELFGSHKNVSFKSAIAKLATANITPQAAVPQLPMSGDLMLPANFNNNLAFQQALSEVLGFDVLTGTPFTQTMQAAHATTMSHSAGQPHPGTSLVKAQITKAAQSGDTRNITLQLDPPELGRVEIRMEFGSDNQVKAHIISEKPETHLMLQRDIAALERALQDAGMDTGSDSLNYQMAEDNYGFGDRKDGHNGNSGTDNAKNNTDEDEMEIIETNMNWNVDPETGHVHYNIYA